MSERSPEREDGKGRSKRIQSVTQTIGAVAAIITALVAGAALIFTPEDLHNDSRRLSHRYFVHIDSPSDNLAVSGTKKTAARVAVEGKAKLPSDWNLVVFVQSPDELRYYIDGGGAITVDKDGHWTVPDVQIGTTGSGTNKDYKIVALLIDENGQEQLESALAKGGDAPYMTSLPHNAAKAIRKVHLSA